MQTDNRPLSPHLQVYKPQLTSVLSICHRGSGVVLALGSIILVWWLSALAAGPEAFATVNGVVGSFIGKVILFLFTLALFYHLCNGIRHLVWDTGRGFELESVYRSGYLVVIASVVLTVVVWIVALSTGGA
ncbi:succinate dehydrogenase, cytochrome b556 subunit [Alkalilimnicola ehrlichii MLHE-1]|uniref:Succinate dehydrogenase cytochrome b556 subunit n=1 Tax=Alkalilimnicola ehrlichii (strain ATCC BAA-1101 / DSM 17681 / MLHE-1) TaxID=187272 RepID=Q0A906_ALKEH|nr:succinate dehydrogenase, cytochrome b556 subunit [Alkalilimnicola ehrlichii]ABI56681.1 succinate dehydrogenase subunit C [Alkalilimnicola ehrlichii MLHE-1]